MILIAWHLLSRYKVSESLIGSPAFLVFTWECFNNKLKYKVSFTISGTITMFTIYTAITVCNFFNMAIEIFIHHKNMADIYFCNGAQQLTRKKLFHTLSSERRIPVPPIPVLFSNPKNFITTIFTLNYASRSTIPFNLSKAT